MNFKKKLCCCKTIQIPSFITVSVSTGGGHIASVEMDKTIDLKENIAVVDG